MFIKIASLNVRRADINFNDWRVVGKYSDGFNERKAQAVANNFPKDRYLLSHCTIVCSVEVNDGFKNKKSNLSDYLIAPECSKFINHNYDAWENKLLLKSYHTFVGAYNYKEHVQIPELSKGYIVDAYIRPVYVDKVSPYSLYNPDMVISSETNHTKIYYVDILVATDRRHEALIDDIKVGRMRSLSMGTRIKYSICTKCGNVAEDAINLCDHIRYHKGKYFNDSNGERRMIAELCGHYTDPSSNTFIEASWVADPAFLGAVVRSFLVPGKNVEELIGNRVASVGKEKVNQELAGYMRKAASIIKIAIEDEKMADEDDINLDELLADIPGGGRSPNIEDNMINAGNKLKATILNIIL